MLSVIILTKNEEKNILRAIKSVDFADEIIIADDGSEDKTIAVAKKYNVKIISLKTTHSFSEKRNTALGEARGEWLFF
jgi:glycosyltransferase involved in cell wall biosynthesis